MHPDNAVCQGERLLALDWANLARGDARLDVARTLFLLEDAPLPSAAPAGLEALRRAAGEEYLAAMGASRGALRAFLAAVLAARAGEAPEEAAALAPRIARAVWILNRIFIGKKIGGTQDERIPI